MGKRSTQDQFGHLFMINTKRAYHWLNAPIELANYSNCPALILSHWIGIIFLNTAISVKLGN